MMGFTDKLKSLNFNLPFRRHSTERSSLRTTPAGSGSAAPPPSAPSPADRSLVASSIILVSSNASGSSAVLNPEQARVELIAKVRKSLDTQPPGWTEDEYAVGKGLFNALNEGLLTSRVGFTSKSVKTILSEYLTDWNLAQAADKSTRSRLSFQSKSSSKLMEKSDKLYEKLEGMFSSLILGIQHALTEKYEDGLLRYLKGRQKIESPKENEFTTLVIRVYDEVSQNFMPYQASAVIKIDTLAQELNDFYNACVNDYGTFRLDPDKYLNKALGALNDYYKQLLQVNFTIYQTNPWREPSAKKALQYYFDQRELLYTIYSQTRKPPESIHTLNVKLEFMAEYREYLTEMIERNEAFTTSLKFGSVRVLDFGSSRREKIEAGLNQYYFLSLMPRDVFPEREPKEQTLVEEAGEYGRLGELKKKVQEDLGLGCGTESNPFTPLEKLKPKSYSLS